MKTLTMLKYHKILKSHILLSNIVLCPRLVLKRFSLYNVERQTDYKVIEIALYLKETFEEKLFISDLTLEQIAVEYLSRFHDDYQ